MASGSSTSAADVTATIAVTNASGQAGGHVVVGPIQAMIDKAVGSSISSLSSSIERMVQEAVRKNSAAVTGVTQAARPGGFGSGGSSGDGLRAPISSVIPLGSLPSSTALAGMPVLPQVSGP